MLLIYAILKTSKQKYNIEKILLLILLIVYSLKIIELLIKNIIIKLY